MLEQVRGLGIDLERVLLIEQARVEPLTVHKVECITNDYTCVSATVARLSPTAINRLRPSPVQ